MIGKDAISIGADGLWSTLMKNLTNYVNEKGGNAVNNEGVGVNLSWEQNYKRTNYVEK